MKIMNRTVKYFVIDVDGTMTDAGIYYDENGNELKKFCTKDAAGFFAAHKVGIKLVVLTGRECAATAKRMAELKVDYLFQNVKDKKSFLKNFMTENSVSREELGYIGDDLNDFPPMQLAGFVGCPADSCPEIVGIADYVSEIRGGHGAVRDVIEHVLRMSGEWTIAISEVYDFGR
ncbi:MAG: HAD-IIIA family hydrolase [Hungatella sp.]|jgi:3-deoxy-D-manno-octulosonate 8-phosphate phosphatase (KDO 8-P phosphatase)|nr:HAD-IIIA family hydrolase [Hungatella sp.]